MFADRSLTNGRIAAAVAAVLVQALLLYALLFGLTVRIPVAVDTGLKIFGVAPPPPPPPIERPRVQPPKEHRREGAAAPANLRSKATDIVAPRPLVPPILPLPIVTAPVPDIGLQASTGAAPVPGPGTGAGGIGNGTGSGRGGDGDGDGDYSPPVRIGGRFGFSDVVRDGNPAEELTVGVRYAVEIDGRVDRCEITRSSGDHSVDAATCALIEQRFRYRPSRAPNGRPVRSGVEEDQSFIHRLETDRDPR